MAASDLTITVADVKPGSDATISRGTAGTTITQGQPVYSDSADSNKIKLADADDTAAKATCVGIALNEALLDQPVDYISAGDLDVGSILTAGEVYAVSVNAGKIAPFSDNVTGDYTSLLGYAKDADTLTVSLTNTGVQLG